MRITALTKDKKHLTKISLSNGEEIFLDNDVCAEGSLFEDMEIEPEEIKELKLNSDIKRAKSRALWYLDRMDYTEKSLFDKLIRAGFSKTASARAMADLTELGIVDDRRYAERYGESLSNKNASKREAYAKMLQKGLRSELIKEVLENTAFDEENSLSELIERKYSAKLKLDNGYQKVFSALVRKGFSYQDIKSALNKHNEELEFCEE